MNKLTKKILYKEYIINKFSIRDIAKKYNTYEGSIFKYLRRFNIKTRTRSEARKLAFKQNKCDVSGNKNPAFKFGHSIGFKKCKICNNPISLKATYCIYCANQINGFNQQKHYHCSCGTEVSNSYAKICKKCYLLFLKISENNTNWLGGISKKGYSFEFNDSLKESIRHRDNHQCQNCDMTEEENLIVYGRVLDIHHIDYNKKNCNENNLITLCQGCNIRANYNRNYWKEIYTNKIILAKKVL